MTDPKAVATQQIQPTKSAQATQGQQTTNAANQTQESKALDPQAGQNKHDAGASSVGEAGQKDDSKQQPQQELPTLNKPNKMEVATEIYKQMIKVKGVTRQDIITKFVEQAGLTKAGAATYYQMIKQKLAN